MTEAGGVRETRGRVYKNLRSRHSKHFRPSSEFLWRQVLFYRWWSSTGLHYRSSTFYSHVIMLVSNSTTVKEDECLNNSAV